MARLEEISTNGTYSAKVNCCKICGSRSTGVHYGVVACEGCKALFRRALANPSSYKCKGNGDCQVASTGWTPDLCRGCRYQKCLSMGMSLQGHPTWWWSDNRGDPEGSKHQGRKKGHAKEDPFLISNIPLQSQIHNSQRIERKTKKMGRVPRRNIPVADIPISPSPAFKQQPPPRPVYLLVIPASAHIQSLVAISPEMKQDLSFAQAVREERSHKIQRVLEPSRDVEVAVPRRLFDYSDDSHRITLSGKRSPSTQNSFLKALNVGLERTIKTVQNAMESVFGEEFASWNAFMHDARVNGIVPHQPQVSPKTMMAVIADYLTLHVKRHCDFAYQLPGFIDLEANEQQRLLKVKWSNSWLFVHAPYFQTHDSYILAGPDRIHYGRYWYSQIVSESYVNSVLDFTGELSSLHLGPLESFLLFAAQNFRPDHNDDYSPDAETHRFLYAHYMQCFEYILQCTRPSSTIPGLLGRTKALSDRLDIFQKINDDYVRTIEANKATTNNAAQDF